jgi:hypothetical protein
LSSVEASKSDPSAQTFDLRAKSVDSGVSPTACSVEDREVNGESAGADAYRKCAAAAQVSAADQHDMTQLIVKVDSFGGLVSILLSLRVISIGNIAEPSLVLMGWFSIHPRNFYRYPFFAPA